MNQLDIHIIEVELEFIPLTMRVPLKFGSEISIGYDTAKVRMTVMSENGRCSCGIGESPLSPAWAWPDEEAFALRLEKMRDCCRTLAERWKKFPVSGHPMEIGTAFNDCELHGELPHLAELTCNAAFDLALHDAYGNLHGVPVYQTYNRKYMNHDLGHY